MNKKLFSAHADNQEQPPSTETKEVTIAEALKLQESGALGYFRDRSENTYLDTLPRLDELEQESKINDIASYLNRSFNAINCLTKLGPQGKIKIDEKQLSPEIEELMGNCVFNNGHEVYHFHEKDLYKDTIRERMLGFLEGKASENPDPNLSHYLRCTNEILSLGIKENVLKTYDVSNDTRDISPDV